MTASSNWTQISTPKVKFPSHIPEDGTIIEEDAKCYKAHRIVVSLDEKFLVNGESLSRYSASEKGQLLALPLWGSCKIRGLEIFKIPGNWIRVAKMPMAPEKFSYLNEQPLSPNGPFTRPTAPAEPSIAYFSGEPNDNA